MIGFVLEWSIERDKKAASLLEAAQDLSAQPPSISHYFFFILGEVRLPFLNNPAISS